jgi:hypothetical protein
VIPPGGVGKVTASLDTSHYKGPIAKSVSVRINDSKAAPIVLQLKGEIVTLIDVAPTENPVLRMTVGERKSTEVTVAAADRKPFDVLAVQADPSVEVTVRPDPQAASARKAKRSAAGAVARGSSRYVVTIAPSPSVTVGQTIANVTLTTNRARAEKVALRPVLIVAGRVAIEPSYLHVQPGPEPIVLHAKIVKSGGGPLKVLGVESADPDFTAKTTSVGDGREYDLAVTYTGKPGRGLVSSRITVKIDEPGQPTVILPITGRI